MMILNVHSLIFGSINSVLLVVVFLFLIRIYIGLPRTKFSRKLFWWRGNKEFDISDYEAFVYQLAYALKWMSGEKVGALIVIEKEKSLDDYIAIGYQMSAKLTSELLITIFSNKKSSLHDGGVIVRGMNVAAVSSYFPVTQTKLTTSLGARHRAASGLTENTDSVAFIVSETTGKVSYSTSGKISEIFSEDINSVAGKIFELLNFYID